MLLLLRSLFVIAIIIHKVFAAGKLKELPHCNDEKLGLVLVSTLDGKLSALDSSGQLKWNFISSAGILLKSSIYDFQLTNNGEHIRIIPSLTGSLYKFNGHTIDALPINAEHLLHSSALYNSGLVIAGGREISTSGINMRTGRCIYECDMTGCRNNTNNDKDDSSELQDVLLLERNTLTLRAHEPRHGKEIWNVSVAQHNIRMPRSHCINVDDRVNKLQFHALLQEGVINARTFHPLLDETKVKWQYTFDSPIVNVWTWDGKDLLDVDLFISKIVEEGSDQMVEGSNMNSKKHLLPTPAIYLAVHQKQLYIHESRKMLEMLRISRSGIGADNNRQHLNNQVMTRPSKDTISTARIQFDNDQALAIYKNDWDIVNGNGYYLYTEEDNQIPNNSDSCTDKLGDLHIVQQYSAILGTVPAIILTTFLYYMFFVRPRKTQNRLTRSPNNNEIEPAPSYLPTYHSCINSILTAPVATFYKEDDIELLPLQRTASVAILPVDVESRIQNIQIDIIEKQFVSRYTNDFETLRSLGKGGFGVVFEVKQKIDECRYAIKRITIPDKEHNKRVVLREVQALANLDHAHIVRYFNSWIEHPPPEWIKDHDRAFFEPDDSTSQLSSSSVSLAISPSDNICDILASSSQSSSQEELDVKSTVRKKRRSTLVGQHADSIVVDLTPDFDNNYSSKKSSSSNSDGIVFESGSDEGQQELSEETENESDTKMVRNKAPVCLYIQMQLCRKESLRDWLNEHRTERIRSNTMQMFKQIVDAVGYVHEHGLIHRDLKPNNVFFAMNGSIKIGDFGLVKTMGDVDWCNQQKTDEDNKHTSAIYRSHTKDVGTHLYMSPEQAARNRYNYKVDIYALGIILFELLVPFDTESERIRVLQNIRLRTYPQTFETNYNEEKLLLNKMLAKDPHERPSTNEIKSIPFIFNV